MDPQQELFTELLVRLRKIDACKTYDGALPPEGTAYPFIYLGNLQQVDREAKYEIFGNVYVTIDVWHDNPEERGTLSSVMLEIKNICRRITHTHNFAWNIRGVSQEILPDTTTKQPLMHGILSVEYSFS